MTTVVSEFASAERGSWLVVARAEANHEAHHAVAAVLLDVELREVRIDRPHHGVLGHVVSTVHSERWRNAGVAVAPLAIEGTAPASLLATFDDHDARSAAAHYLLAGRAPEDWPAFVAFVRSLMLTAGSRRAITAVSRALLERGALPGGEVRRIVGEAGAERQPGEAPDA